MRVSEELAWTTNSNLYRKLLKLKREQDGEIRCGYCPYHKYENDTRKPYRNWKRYRKTQYKHP